MATNTLTTLGVWQRVSLMLAAGALLIISTTSRAQSGAVAASNSGSRFELRPFVSVYVPVGHRRNLLMDGLGIGTQGSWRVSRRFAMSGAVSWTQTKDRTSPPAVDIVQYDVGVERRTPASRSGRSSSTGDPRYCTKTSPARPLDADKRDTRGSLTIRSTASATSRRIWFASGLSSSPAPPRSLQRSSRKPSVPVRRAGLPRSPLAITLLGWAWAHLRTRPARNAAP